MTTIPRPYLRIAANKAAAWHQHKADWEGCTDCPLHRSRSKTVFTRGQLPCRVLFIGEAPGKSEDLLGYPFIGEAGYLLQEIIEEAQVQYAYGLNSEEYADWQELDNHLIGIDNPFRYAITNIVLCRPPEDASVDIRPPKREEAQACSRRLSEFIALAEPQMIVLVGVPARKFVARQEGIHYTEIMHPAAMLRITPPIKQEVQVKRAINTIVDNLTILDGLIADGYRAGPQPEGMTTTTTGGDIGKRAIPPKMTVGEIVRRVLASLNPGVNEGEYQSAKRAINARPTRKLSKVRRAHPRR